MEPDNQAAASAQSYSRKPMEAESVIAVESSCVPAATAPCACPPLLHCISAPCRLFWSGTHHHIHTQILAPYSSHPEDCSAHCPAQGQVLMDIPSNPMPRPVGVLQTHTPPTSLCSALCSQGQHPHADAWSCGSHSSCSHHILVTISWYPTFPHRHSHLHPSSLRLQRHLLCRQHIPATGQGEGTATGVCTQHLSVAQSTPGGLEPVQV